MTKLINTISQIYAADLLRSLPDQSIDAVITDPPYAEINRDYGRLSESAWMSLMKDCTQQFKRVLKPTGSAVIILQPNSERVGRMRTWLWDFLSWAGKTWNIVQDMYWWNTTVAPTVHVQRKYGLMRPSVKYCVWLGAENCYRNQDEVLWAIADSTLRERLEDRALHRSPSGQSYRRGRIAETAIKRGDSTPYNLLPINNVSDGKSSGDLGHSAGTPYLLADWWVRYITQSGEIVLDPFCGAGTIPLAAVRNHRRYIGGDQSAEYVQMSIARLGVTECRLL